nr:unnamed protein product [Spirometra erinaceieuropaei]
MILREFAICTLLVASLVCLQAHSTEDAYQMSPDVVDEEQNLLDAALVEGELEDVPSLEGERVRIRLGGRRGLGGRIFRSRGGRIFWQYLGAR